MNLSTALEGFFITRTAEGYATGTLTSYRWSLTLLSKWLNNPELENISHQDLLNFFAYLHTDYHTRLSGSSIENIWKAIRSFYNWAAPELNLTRPDNNLPRPRYTSPQVQPFTQEEIAALLKACDRTAPANTERRSHFTMKRPTAKRDRAMILLLLDTGLRVSEVARLTIADINLESGEINVKPFGSGRKTKGRLVYIGKTTRSALWKYLATRDSHPSAPLFLTEQNDGPLNRDSIRLLINRLAINAGVQHAHPHKFRHTFAIMFLRNGGDVFTLQRLLGHSTLEMVRHYLALADSDSQAAHQRASPADRWKL